MKKKNSTLYGRSHPPHDRLFIESQIEKNGEGCMSYLEQSSNEEEEEKRNERESERNHHPILSSFTSCSAYIILLYC